MENVLVLLSTYNGEKYLDEQIKSLIKQKGVNVSILARDDGSLDSTKEILSRWEKKGAISWYEGPNLKPAKSFWHLVNKASNADYYAFCDQDDVWETNKLNAAIEALKKCDTKKPSLYYSPLNPVDQNLNPQIYSHKKKKDSLGRSMLISYAAGCTMVFNKELLDFAQKYNPEFLRMHDQWMYLLCISIDGNIVYDQVSHIKYRQHASNTVGIKVNVLKQLKRLRNSYKNGDSERWKQVKELLDSYSSDIPEANLRLINKVVNYKNSWKSKMTLIFDKDIKCGSVQKDIMFIFAIFSGRF